MVRLRKTFPLLILIAAPFVLYQYFFYFARKPLNNALLEQVKKNDLAQVESLLVRGADINSRDSTKFRSCTDANPPRTRYTPLILSTFRHSRDSRVKRNTAMMDLLLKHGANPNLGDTHSKTPLHFAASQGDVAAVQALLSHGADANVKDYVGDTPLIAAAYGNNIKVVKLLLAHGADVNIKGQSDFSALARATGYCDNLEVMKLLIAHGAEVNTRDRFGATPLHDAASYGRTEAIQTLLQHGADPKAKDDKGRTPLTMVVSYGTKALDESQDSQRSKVMQRQALMTKLLTDNSTDN